MTRMAHLLLVAVVVCFFVTFSFLASDAFAVGSSGYETGSYSTSSLALSNAVVANPEDASTVAFNPAGLTKIPGKQITGGVTLIAGSTLYEGAEGRNDEKGSETVHPVPFGYASFETPIDKLTLGVGSNSLFGLSSRYSTTGNFEYTGFYNEMRTESYYVSAGYEINPQVSIGAGFHYMKGTVKQNGKLNSAFLTAALGGDAQNSDYELDIAGDGVGYNLGLLWEPSEKHSLGFYYRSQVRMRLQGQITADRLGPIMTAIFGKPTLTTAADGDYKFPYNLTLGYMYKPNDKVTAEIDFGYTGWSCFDRTEVEFDADNAILNSFRLTNRDFHDSISIQTGVSYQMREDWKLRGGYYFYQMASSKANYAPDIIDGHRHGFSIGFQHENDDWVFDVMYIYTLIDEVEISNVVGIGNGADFDGNYSGYSNIVSVGLTYKM